jgi:hypothetical protein
MMVFCVLFAVINSVFDAQEHAVEILKKDARNVNKRIAAAIALVDKFRGALFDMREDYRAATGGNEPNTVIPDETVEPDSGGEENANIDGRKRARSEIENEVDAPY